MRGTYNLNGIILSRLALKERDSRIVFYSFENGKIDLVVRGTSSLKSKLSGHIEPISFCSIMAVEGKQFDYAGAVVCVDAYANIKNNYSKIVLAGKAIAFLIKEIKEEERDENIFNTLKSFLDVLNNSGDSQINYLPSGHFALFYHFFILKIMKELGFSPLLNCCVNNPQHKNNEIKYFDYKKGGVICAECAKEGHSFQISKNAVDLLNLALKEDFEKLFKTGYQEEFAQEVEKIVNSFYRYQFA